MKYALAAMSVVEFAIVEPNTLAKRQVILAERMADKGIKNFKPGQLKYDTFGKPYLERDEGLIGYSFSNARFDGGSIGLMALVDGALIGIDVELWPRRPSDKVFLETVASPEDEAVLSVLGNGGYDAGVALWVIKEAALKCSGEVMIDPRHLAVSQSRDGLFHIGPSLTASTAIPMISITLFELRAEKWSELVFLCGAALYYESAKVTQNFRQPFFYGVGWHLSLL